MNTSALHATPAPPPAVPDARAVIRDGLRALIGPDRAADLIGLAVELYRLRRGRPEAFVECLTRFRREAAVAGVSPAVLPAVERVAIRPW